MRYLLDTNAVIAIVNDPRSKPALRARRENLADVGVSAVVYHELFYGAYNSGRARHNLSVIDALAFAVVDFDKEDARRSGEIRVLLASRGKPIGSYDMLIAGQALARNLTLVTHNLREFARMPGLNLEDWEA